MQDNNTDLLPPPPPEKEDFPGIEIKPEILKTIAHPPPAPVSDEDIFSFASLEFDKRIGTVSPETGENSLNISEVMPDGMIAVSADLYVEILEAGIEGLCKFISGNDKGSYLFDKIYKQKYKDISEKFFRYQNIKITPGQLFAIATVALISGSGIKAFKDRKARLRVEQFQARKAAVSDKGEVGSQLQLFDPGRIEPGRKFFQIDIEGFYVKTPGGLYAKKEERERADPILMPFLQRYFSENGKYPTAKQVKAYIAN